MKKSPLILLAVFVLCVPLFAQAATFSDVPASDTDYEYIEDIVSRDIASGAGDGTFGPDRLVTRAEATKFIANTVGLSCGGYAGTEPDFTDTANTVGLKQYIACFKGQGFIDGYGDGRFGPQDPVRKAEFVKMLLNASGVPVDMSYQWDYEDLTDDTLTPYVADAMDYGIIPVGSGNRVNNHSLLRRDVARYLYDFIAATVHFNLAGTYNIPEPTETMQTVTYYLVEENVDDMSNLDQYMVEVEKEVAMTEMNTTDLIDAALTALFALEEVSYGSNKNFLYPSDVTVESVYWIGAELVVELNGNFVGIGAMADPFIKKQITETIKHYNPGGATIRLNGSEDNWDCLFDMSGLCGTEQEIIQEVSEYCEEFNIPECSPVTSYSMVYLDDVYAVVEVGDLQYLLKNENNEWSVSIASQEDNICDTGSGNADLVDYCSL